MIVLAATAAIPAPQPSTVQAPPARKGDCRWIHGRFEVANGSMVQRIWIVGTHRVVALPDDSERPPAIISAYETDPAAEPMFADFRVCALEDSKAGWMRLVRVTDVRNAIVAGTPFSGQKRP